jgi:hypothetical protein
MIDTLDRWHEIIRSGDPSGLDDLLSAEVVFHSPVVHSPQVGKVITKMYLAAAFQLLVSGEFRYTREASGSDHAMLEFETEIDDVRINGVDILSWDTDGRLVEIKVMLRPLKAIGLVHERMAALLGGP